MKRFDDSCQTNNVMKLKVCVLDKYAVLSCLSNCFFVVGDYNTRNLTVEEKCSNSVNIVLLMIEIYVSLY